MAIFCVVERVTNVDSDVCFGGHIESKRRHSTQAQLMAYRTVVYKEIYIPAG